MLAPFLSHVFCNVMSLPDLQGAQARHPGSRAGEQRYSRLPHQAQLTLTRAVSPESRTSIRHRCFLLHARPTHAASLLWRLFIVELNATHDVGCP